MATIILMFILVRLIIASGTSVKWNTIKIKAFGLRLKSSDELFDQYFIDPKVYYAKLFKSIPSVGFIKNVDTKKIFKKINSNAYGDIVEKYQRIYHNWEENKIAFYKTVFVTKNKMVILLGSEWVQFCYAQSQHALASRMLKEFKKMKAPEKEKDFEINIISLINGSLDWKTLAIKPTKLDIDLYYNEDFKEVDTIIKQRLAKENDKGIVLLHGIPGTGKTTYLRHLIGQLKKKVMFVSPSVAGNLMNPEFMDLLLDNPNAILVIEDAENIIMDRRYRGTSSVSNLLNISDGLLSDCLNVQIVCTFNSELGFIDSALLRKGRLIAKYEFGKLSVEKAIVLRNHLGLKTEITRPMTLAEITNPGDNSYQPVTTSVVGFRRELLMEN